MKTTFIFSIFLFLLFSATSFCRIKGTWRQVFPEENGEIPGPRYGQYMCSIGDQQVLMLGGSGIGNPYYYNETWLYDYKTNTWTKINTERIPDTYSWTSEAGNHLYQISKTRAIASCLNRPWIFDLDSMEWFIMPHEGSIFNGTYIKENVMFSYDIQREWEETYPFNAIYAGRSSLGTMHPEEPFDSPDFLTWEVVNNEWETKQGPVASFPTVQHSSYSKCCFALNYDSQNIIFIPTWGGLQPHSFMSMPQTTYKWLFLDEGNDTLPLATRRIYNSITGNATVLLTAGATYIAEYLSTEDLVQTYKIDTASIPSKHPNTIAQIKDGVVMLFGGISPNGLSNETWIFELEHLDVVDNTGENVKIYTLDDNLYMLDNELKDAALYNILGQKAIAVTGDKLDLNPLPIGIYFLQYNEKGVAKTAKMMKK